MPDEILQANNQQSQVQAPDTSVGQDGAGKTDSMLPGYLAGASKEQKEAWTSSKAQFPEKFTDFLDQHMQLEARLKDAVVVPNKDAPKEQWDQYRKARGIPDTPDGYTFEKPQLPEGLPYSEQTESWFKQKAFDLGIPPDEAQKMFNEWSAAQVTMFNAAKEAQKKASEERAAAVAQEYSKNIAQLRQSWGAQYDENLAGVESVFRNERVVPTRLREKIVEAGLQNNLDLVNLLLLVHQATRSDRKIGILTGMGDGVEPTNGTPRLSYGPGFTAATKR